MNLYILVDKKPVEVNSMEEWSVWFSKADRRVAYTELGHGFNVSTVFLGLDHSFGSGPPLLFETMGFNDYGDTSDIFDRYSTWEEAECGHIDAVEKMMADLAAKGIQTKT